MHHFHCLQGVNIPVQALPQRTVVNIAYYTTLASIDLQVYNPIVQVYSVHVPCAFDGSKDCESTGGTRDVSCIKFQRRWREMPTRNLTHFLRISAKLVFITEYLYKPKFIVLAGTKAQRSITWVSASPFPVFYSPYTTMRNVRRTDTCTQNRMLGWLTIV